MVLSSPAEALGDHATLARELIVELVQDRHERSADAHDAANTRYGILFGSQWRDLLRDSYDAFKERGFGSYKLTPGGYSLPVVNDALVFVTRMPEDAEAIEGFASSKTRAGSFFVQPTLDLFGDSFIEGGDEPRNAEERERFEKLAKAAGAVMPVVLVMVHSSPRQLTSIDWAIAEYRAGLVHLHGKDTIWSHEFAGEGVAVDVESFDSGVPEAPVVALQARGATSDE
ncbi:hypothetical protein LQ938_11645 [Microbacterium sp. cx-55]|uniref:hypothetical protein n=1 Tax=Microbacterium sp. cx-55 TaxID=2875948 RepID=UPI001CC12A05|nr:hypothetical protein [Microbacterium sp. cx-55]MBZ4488074.1 hypothetical protein [Microbacterium sp. cx-55]UGB34520.1 hypothetical protein LQ938_11645 [Microbacterium sp. cx-55]